MVWHAFLLNPDDFDFYCVKHRLERMRKAPLPWQRIVRFHSLTIDRPTEYILIKVK